MFSVGSVYYIERHDISDHVRNDNNAQSCVQAQIKENIKAL